ncbi:protein MpNPF19 [Marchantia polymorpha subsp. ruderalis]|uniref:Uncharacterized protein n=2 Tax=Marchantia polymorpha TaxID=3197 RepID=A0AAF6B6A7_MARPO|nr:hypothetical protein MARPO_0044s0033 [Marchantia polymorpha]BBN07541.1 hypothetical protein Mp_4g04400 [Marchantia polymorpha subsp. ruderalis]|eukprot:PTQ39559.1 hypothetical protein MARPO_0044s0033 [Marchantia polymorpha]
MGLEDQRSGNELPLDRAVGDGSVTLRGTPSDKTKTGTWRAAAFVYVLAFGNSVVLMVITGNLMEYTVNTLHLDFATAANMTSNLTGTSLLLPIFFGFLADAFFGPFWVIIGACVVYAAGLVTLVLSVSLPELVPPRCDAVVCKPASQHIQSVFMAGLFITCMGTAGVKPNVLSLGQQQFDDTDPVEKEKGTLFFSIYYAVYNFGLFVASTLFFWIQTDVGFKQGYGIMAGFFFFSAIVFCSGIPFLRHQRPGGSPLTALAQVVVAAIRNRRLPLPADASQLYETSTTDRVRKIAHTNRLRFLDKAAIVRRDASGLPTVEHKQQLEDKWYGWKLSTVTHVEVLKTVIQLFPIWVCCSFLYLMAAQEFTFNVQQASGMDRRLGTGFKIPPATITCASMIGALAFIFIYETFLVKFFKKYTGHPRGLSPFVRIGMALFLATLVMVVSALVEIRRVHTIKAHELTALDVKQGRIPMSAYWLLPQLLISGICNPLLGTAQLELFYQEGPENMVSLAMALTFGGQALGRFISTGTVNSVKKYTGNGPGQSWLTSEFNTGGLTKFYWLIAIMEAINFLVYLLAAHFYSYKQLAVKDQPLSPLKPLLEPPAAPASSDTKVIPPVLVQDSLGSVRT